METTAARSSDARGKKVRRYLLARHGETNFNRDRRVQGTLDSPCVLTRKGASQADALGAYVARRQAGGTTDDVGGSHLNDYDDGGDVRTLPATEEIRAAAAPLITRTWCSPLTRCRQTYAAVDGCCSDRAPISSPTIRADLREVDFREWQGRLRAEIIECHSGRWNAFRRDPKSLRLDGGFAPVLDCWERGLGNWDTIRRDAAAEEGGGDDAIFVMTHGAIGQCMLLQSLGISIETYGKGRTYSFDNCECVEIEWEDGEDAARRWRRVHPKATPWRSAGASMRMASGAELSCSRINDKVP